MKRRKLKRKQKRARMAKLADAADLKSDDAKLRSEINTIKTISY
jgi:hypothetical protein